MSPEDRLRIGWEEIAEFFRGPVVTVQGWKKEMLQTGATYYHFFGALPSRREQFGGFESDLRRWRKNVGNKARRKKRIKIMGLPQSFHLAQQTNPNSIGIAKDR